MDKHLKYLNLNLIKKNERQFELFDDRILNLLNTANKELKKVYKGKVYEFGLVEKEIIEFDNVKISPKSKRKIKEKWLEFNSMLSEIKRQYEKILQNSYENGDL